MLSNAANDITLHAFEDGVEVHYTTMEPYIASVFFTHSGRRVYVPKGISLKSQTGKACTPIGNAFVISVIGDYHLMHGDVEILSLKSEIGHVLRI